jgi:hypothetical protein
VIWWNNLSVRDFENFNFLYLESKQIGAERRNGITTDLLEVAV